MAFGATVYRVLIASPSDVAAARETVVAIIQSVNSVMARERGVVLLPVMWELDSTPETGEHPQAILNRQMVDSCDIAIGLFWTRLGTPTAVAESGAVEEIERMRAANKQVLLYFSTERPDLQTLDTSQLDKVRALKRRYQQEALYDTFDSLAELQNKLNRHLARVVQDLSGPEGHTPIPQLEPPAVLLIKEQFASFVRHFEAEWDIARRTPSSWKTLPLRDGIDLALRLYERLHDFDKLMWQKVDISFNEAITSACHDAWDLHTRDEYRWAKEEPDIGRFWRDGDALIDKLKGIQRTLEQT